MTTVELQAIRAEIKKDVAHLVRPIWRAAFIVIALTAVWFAVWRIVRVEVKQQEINRRDHHVTNR